MVEAAEAVTETHGTKPLRVGLALNHRAVDADELCRGAILRIAGQQFIYKSPNGSILARILILQSHHHHDGECCGHDHHHHHHDADEVFTSWGMETIVP